MGLLLLPIILLTFLAWLLSLVVVVTRIIKHKLNLISILISIPLSTAPYLILLIYWSQIDSMSSIESFLTIPVVCFIIPSIFILPSTPSYIKPKFIDGIIKQIPNSLIFPAIIQSNKLTAINRIIEAIPLALFLIGIVLYLFPSLLSPNLLFDIKLTH
tara:strand:- start:93 stop:566 length:474 start_codon:yes stop_codon:yes gene_type:complete